MKITRCGSRNSGRSKSGTASDLVGWGRLSAHEYQDLCKFQRYACVAPPLFHAPLLFRTLFRMPRAVGRPSLIPLERKTKKWAVHNSAMPWFHGTVHFLCICTTIHKIGYSTKPCKMYPAQYSSIVRRLFVRILKNYNPNNREPANIRKKISTHYVENIGLWDTVTVIRRVTYLRNNRGLICELLLPSYNMLDKRRELWRDVLPEHQTGGVCIFLGVSKTKASERSFSPVCRLGHLHVYLTTNVFRCLSKEETHNFPDRCWFLWEFLDISRPFQPH